MGIIHFTFAVAVLINVTVIAENVASQATGNNAPLVISNDDLAQIRLSLLTESNLPPYITSYLSSYLEPLAREGLAGYVSAGPPESAEKLQLAGNYILKDPLLSQFIQSKNWNVVAQVPPGPAPQQSGDRNGPPYWISIFVPAGFRGIVKDAGRLRFDCSANCLPNLLGN